LIYLTAATSMLASGCISGLTPKGQQVQIAPLNVSKACKRLGKVGITLEGERGLDLREAEKLMRNSAGEMGANMVRWDRIYSASIEGTAFHCPPARRAAVARSIRR
jgi:hypothetical protein